MDPVSTGVSLAASLVTLLAVAADSCESICSLQLRLSKAPDDIRRLVADVHMFQTLLSDVELSSRNLGDEEIPPNLRAIWLKCGEQMRQDLLGFKDIADLLEQSLNGPSAIGKNVIARVRRILSEPTVQTYQKLFSRHIEILGFVHSSINRSQVCTLLAESRCQGLKLDSIEMASSKSAAGIQYEVYQTQNSIHLVRDELDMVKSEMVGLRESSQACNDLLKQALSKKNNSIESALGHFGSFELGPNVQRPFIKQRAHLANHQPYMPRETSLVTSKRVVYWRWSTFRLPIGLLTIEASQEESIQMPNSSISDSEKHTRVAFIFSPPKCVIDSMIQISYLFVMKGNSVPSWQRSQCGSTSIFPQALQESLKDKNLLAAGKLLANMPSVDGVQQLSKYMNTLPLASRSGVNLTPKTITQQSQSFRLSFDTAVGEVTANNLKVDIIYFESSKKSEGRRLVQEQFSRESVCFLLDSSVRKTDWKTDFWTPVCLMHTGDGLEAYKHYICQYLDPFDINDLQQIDRWWFSALIHDDPQFGQRLLRQLGSFYSKGLSCSNYSCIFEDYIATVQEVLCASPEERKKFLLWVCSFGTINMLLPFTSTGIDWIDDIDKNCTLTVFLCNASIAHNRRVFQELLAAGARADNQTLSAFLSRRISADDDFYIDALIDSTLPLLPKDEENPNSNLLAYVDRYKDCDPMDDLNYFEPSPYIIQRLLSSGHACFSHPPCGRDFYLGPELLYTVLCNQFAQTQILVRLDPSLDYAGPPGITNRSTAVKWALHLGYPHLLILLTRNIGKMSKDIRSTLLSALDTAQANLEAPHPRPYPASLLLDWPENDIRRTQWANGYSRNESIEQTFYAQHRSAGGVTYATDLESYILIQHALADMHVDVSSPPSIPQAQPSAIEANALSQIYTLMLHQLELLGYSFSQRFLGIRSGLTSLSAISCVDYVLVPVGIVVSIRALLTQQLVEVVFWLFQLPRLPNAVFKALLVALLGFGCVFWTHSGGA
ncbi:hypothetical protein MMC07_004475 [Pseudocyphellaria aurata]|nr:hypothetical protein [Pseudocyphellaria aurata]